MEWSSLIGSYNPSEVVQAGNSNVFTEVINSDVLADIFGNIIEALPGFINFFIAAFFYILVLAVFLGFWFNIFRGLVNFPTSYFSRRRL